MTDNNLHSTIKVTHAEVSVKAVLGTEDGSTQAISSLDALQAPSREPADVKEIKLQQPATESQSVLASPRRLPRYSKKIADPLSIYLEDTQGNAYVLSRPFDTQQIRPDSRLLNDFMLMVCATAIGAIISETIRIPVFLGHLVGGLVIGPHYLNGVQQLVQISSIAQLGSAFLLFELGLHFSLSKIAKVARAAFFGGILAQVSFFVLFSQLAWLRQTSVTEGLIIGSFLSMSSTILCSRDIASRNAKEDAESSMSIGILLVQDLLLGVDLALMPLLRISSGGSANVFEVISKLVAPVLQACVLLIVTFILGCGIIPRLLPYIQQTKSPETFFLLCVMVIVGMGALSERLNLSFELGAFSGGLSMSYVRPHIHHAIAAVLEALKGFWGSLFFASIGLILDPFFMWDNLYEVLLVLVTFVTIKFLVLFFLLKCSKHGFFLSVRVALMLSHLGEFGFVILEKAVRYNLLTRKVHLLLLGSIGISLITTPFFLKLLACLPSEGEIDPSLTHQSTKPIEEKNHGSIFQKTWYSNILYGVAKVFHYRPHGTVLNSAYEHVKVETPDNYEPQHSTSHVVDIIVSQHQSSNAPNEEVQWIPSTETKHIAYETLPPAFTTVWPTVNEEQCPELPHTSNNSGSFELCTCEASRHRESSVKGKLQEIDRQAE